MDLDRQIVSPLLDWYDNNKRILPWRGGKDPYAIWVSEIMLQQTRVEAVKPYYDRFMAALPDVAALAAVDDDELMKLWEGLGYYNRARNLKKAAIQIMEEYDGVFPSTYDDIISLPGIGAYTAGAISSIAFGERIPAVDGNVLRILSRLMLYAEDVLSQRAKDEAKTALESIMPERPDAFNQALMELGAIVCAPNGAPHCNQCPWESMCQAKALGCQLDYPKKKSKKARRVEKKTVFIVGDGNRLVIHKRPDTGLLAGLYELPNVEGHLAKKQVEAYVRELGLEPLRVKKMETAKHIFSHVEWHMISYQILVEPFDHIDKDDFLLASEAEIRETYSIPSAFGAFFKMLDIKRGQSAIL